jgi:putative transposase
MRNVRRYQPRGAPVFITIVCRDHAPLLAANQAKDAVVACLRRLRADQALAIYAWVVLDDHIHLLLDRCRPNFSSVVGRLKLCVGRVLHRKDLWQARFYDHVIRNADDLRAHVDYIHFNPRKHEVTASPATYRWSSIQRFIAAGDYPADWGENAIPATIGDDTGSE